MEKDKSSLIKKQVEYYLSDENLKTDKFFQNKIKEDKEGWMDISFIMNCNKIKQLTVDQDELIEAIKDSEEVEYDKGGVRRKDNKALPELVVPEKEEKKEEPDEPGVIKEKDFKNPKIIVMKTTAKEDSEEGPSWRDLEKDLAEKFPTIKILYSRLRDLVGQLAISSHSTDQEAVDRLIKDPFTSAGYIYTFEIPSDDALKEFWEQHGSHYEMVTKQKLRRMKKRPRDDANGEGSHKRQKQAESEKQFTIAGTTYANINKVKSKAKTIMNIKDDGQKLEGYEEEFMKEIIKHHEKHDQKMKDFSHFIVDEHPSYRNTRCFFVVKVDGAKEDFSMTKCIKKMEESE